MRTRLLLVVGGYSTDNSLMASPVTMMRKINIKFRHFLLLAIVSLVLPGPQSSYAQTQHPVTDNATPGSASTRFLTTQSPANHPDPAYLLTLGRWRREHAEALSQPNGWLSLIALEWLKPGDTTVGSDVGSTLKLDHAPAHLATFRLTGGTVALVPPAGDFSPATTSTTIPHHRFLLR